MNQTIKKIEEGIVFAKEKGYFLVSENWGDDKRKCACALGCLLVKNNITLDEEYNDTNAMNLLDVNDRWLTAFISGFDNTPWNLDISLTSSEKELVTEEQRQNLKEVNAAGQALRAKFEPLQYDEYMDAFVAGQEDDD
jgi:hypothetical protein